jgi:formate dehydrogenase assembly factor FdhD
VTETPAPPPEASVWIAVNGARQRVLACSPHALDALAAGHLAGDGCITSWRDISRIEQVPGPDGARGVNVVIADALAGAAEALRRHRIEFGCGLRHELDCAPASLRARRRALDVPAVDLSAAFRAVFAAADRVAGCTRARSYAVPTSLSWTPMSHATVLSIACSDSHCSAVRNWASWACC